MINSIAMPYEQDTPSSKNNFLEIISDDKKIMEVCDLTETNLVNVKKICKCFSLNKLVKDSS